MLLLLLFDEVDVVAAVAGEEVEGNKIGEEDAVCKEEVVDVVVGFDFAAVVLLSSKTIMLYSIAPLKNDFVSGILENAFEFSERRPTQTLIPESSSSGVHRSALMPWVSE